MRTKSLLFRTWELFRSWYAHITQRFSDLKVKYISMSASHHDIKVVITY